MANQNTRYPVSDLETYTNPIPNSYLELVVDDYGNRSYVNRKTTTDSFFDFLISSHAIFNKIDDVFNERTIIDVDEATNEEYYRYGSSAFISGQTYFKINPSSNNTTIYEELGLNETVKKGQLEKFIHDKCLELRSLKTEDTAVQYAENGWYKSISDGENPRLDILSLVKFAVPNVDCKINRDSTQDGIPFWHSGPIAIYSNALATIFGKVKLPNTFNNLESSAYYTPELGLWVGVMCDGKMIAITELHNIDETTKIAYFSMQIPMSRDTDYYVVVPFEPDTEVLQTRGEASQKYKLFKINENLIYVLFENNHVEAYTEETLPAEVLDAFATEDASGSPDEEAYDLFSNIGVNSAAVIYYSPVAQETQDVVKNWKRVP